MPKKIIKDKHVSEGTKNIYKRLKAERSTKSAFQEAIIKALTDKIGELEVKIQNLEKGR